MNLRALGRRTLVSATSAVLGLGLIGTLAAAPASAATTHRSGADAVAALAKHHDLSGTTTVTTASGIAATLIKAGIAPLPTIGASSKVASTHPLEVAYTFPITGGDPDLTGPSGDVYHSGGIKFVSKTARLEIGRFDIDLAAGKIYTRAVNFAPGRIPVLDLDLSQLVVHSYAHRTVLSGIILKLDPAAAGALNSTFGLALPTDGSLVFGHARVVIKN